MVVGVFLDSPRRPPLEMVRGWRDFGRVTAAAARHGIRVTIVQSAWEDGRTEIDGVPCHFVREASPFISVPRVGTIRRLPKRLFAQVQRFAPDVIHYEGLIHPRLAHALARRFPSTPMVAQDHGSKAPRGWRRHLWRWGFSGLDAVTFTAREQADPYHAAGILSPALPVYPVVEGSTPFTPGDQAAARATTGMDGDPCLLWVGNLDPNKDPLTVLEALARAPLPKARLHMFYRHAPLLSEVRDRIARLGLADRVVLRGGIGYPAIQECFRAADILVQASHDEGSGYGIIEALACGTPPLVTDIPSFRRITGDGAFGALVPVGDSAAMAAALRDWSPKERVELRRRARAHFERALSFDAIGGQLAQAYRSVRGSA